MKKSIFLLLILLFSGKLFSQQLPSLKATVTDSSLTGYYFISSGFLRDTTLLMVLDRYCDIAYYKAVPYARGGFNFDLLLDGIMNYASVKRHYFMDTTFKLIDSLECRKLYKTDTHDMKMLSNGHYLLLGADTLKITVKKGMHAGIMIDRDTFAIVTMAVIQELDEKRKVVFEWHAKKHFSIEDVDPFFVSIESGIMDLQHVNSLEMDADSNFLLVSRNYNEVTKISRKNGSVIWRLGGKRNDFQFVNCPVPFYGPHDAQRIANGHITLLDNGRSQAPHGVRALEFELDEINKVATLKWSYTYDPALYSQAHGNVQRLDNYKTLVNCGKVNDDLVFVVVDSAGRKLIELTSPDHLDSYRAYYYPSLPWTVNRPAITCFDSSGVSYLTTKETYAKYLWSDSSTIRTISVKKAGVYQVFVPYGNGGFVGSEKVVVTDVANVCRQIPVRKEEGK